MLAVFLVLAAPFLYLNFRSGLVPGDFLIYRKASSLALHLGDPYARNFTEHLRVPLPFTYPPFAAIALVPLALAPPHLSLWVWTSFSLALVAALAWWLVRPSLWRAGWGHPALLGVAAALLVWTVPVGQTLHYGQVNLVLACACLVDCTRVTRGRGVLVGIATAVKLTPGLFILYFAATRQWAAAARAGGTAAGCTLLAAALLPRPSQEYWLHLVFDPSRPGNPLSPINESLYGALLRAGGPKEIWPLLVLGAAGLGLWQAACAHKAGAEVAAVALVGLTAVLISPVSWPHHAVWVVPVLGVLAAWATSPVRPGRVATALVVLALLIVPVPQVASALGVPDHIPIVSRAVGESNTLIFLAMLVALPLVAVTEGERARAMRLADQAPYA
ncbi:MAG: putative integral rane protein [Actinobacteria bacterium]|nr:putative integral rane protein [Actinomycetota bacterium]